MYCISEFCRVCIKNDGTLINIHKKAEDFITFHDKLKFCHHDLICEKTSMLMLLCKDCCVKLDKSYDFLKKCMNSEQVLRGYVTQLENASSFKVGNANLAEMLDRNYKELVSPKLNDSEEIPKDILRSELSVEIKVEPHFEDYESEEISDDDETAVNDRIQIETSGQFSTQTTSGNVNFLDADIAKLCSKAIEIKVERRLNEDCSSEEEMAQINNTTIDKYRENFAQQQRTDVNKCMGQSTSDDFRKKLQYLDPNIAKLATRGIEIIKREPGVSNDEENSDASVSSSFKTIETRSPETIIERIKTKTKVVTDCQKPTADNTRTKNEQVRSSERPKNANGMPLDKPVSTGMKNYQCDVCQKIFSQLCHLKNHILIHTGDKPYECTICQKKFNQSSVLKRHLMVHSGAKPYPCHLCDKKFTHSGNLKKHVQTHSDNKIHECEVCYKKFNLSCYLKKHMAVHSGQKPYECSLCSKRFLEAANLKTHMYSHMNVKPFKCDMCPKAFKHAISLAAHRNTHVEVIKESAD